MASGTAPVVAATNTYRHDENMLTVNRRPMGRLEVKRHALLH